MEEIWKDIPDVDGRYQISNYGTVKSITKVSKNNYVQPETLLKIKLKDGYLTSFLGYKKRSISIKIHKMVARLFVENPDRGLVVKHIDGNIYNCRSDNLMWVKRDHIKGDNLKTNVIKHRIKYPEKYKARNTSKNLKPNVKGNHLHHWSYSLSNCLDVIELPPKLHHELHKYIVYDNNLFMYRIKLTNELLDTKEKHIELINSLSINNDV